MAMLLVSVSVAWRRGGSVKIMATDNQVTRNIGNNV